MKQFMKVCGALLLALVLLTGAALADDAAVRYAVSYTHLTLPTNSRV